MTRIQLRVYIDPGEVEITFQLKREDDSFERTTGIIDTGAQVSLLPNELMNIVKYRLSDRRGKFVVEQVNNRLRIFPAI